MGLCDGINMSGNLGLISIIIPCYNVEKHVRRCVERVQQQEYSQIEVLLVEDGSSDNTLKVCKEMADRYDNVRLLAHEIGEYNTNKNDIRWFNKTVNRGVEETRNLGLLECKGEWILFIDADDYVENNTLSIIDERLKNERNIDFVLFGLNCYFEGMEHRYTYIPNLEEGLYSGEEMACYMFDKYDWGIVSCIGSKLYNRQFIEKNQLRFTREYKFNEDGGFAVNAFYNACNIYVCKNDFYNYLMRDGSTMHSYRPNAFESVNRVIELLCVYFKKYGIFDKKKSYIYKKKCELIIALLYEEIIYKGFKDFANMFRQYARVIKMSEEFNGQENPFDDRFYKLLMKQLINNNSMFFYLIVKAFEFARKIKYGKNKI